VMQWKRSRGVESIRRRKKVSGGSHLSTAIYMGLPVLTLLGSLVFSVVKHERFLQYRRNEWVALPWNGAWPAMPGPIKNMPAHVARSLYAFAGAKPEVLDHIPCHCGCRSKGHRSVHSCFVKHRSTKGIVTEWEEHGLTCPLATDITGDVMLWHDQGKSIDVIRRAIDREFGGRRPGTDTPLPK
jgi:hypothetical protein